MHFLEQSPECSMNEVKQYVKLQLQSIILAIHNCAAFVNVSKIMNVIRQTSKRDVH